MEKSAVKTDFGPPPRARIFICRGLITADPDEVRTNLSSVSTRNASNTLYASSDPNRFHVGSGRSPGQAEVGVSDLCSRSLRLTGSDELHDGCSRRATDLQGPRLWIPPAAAWTGCGSAADASPQWSGRCGCAPRSL